MREIELINIEHSKRKDKKLVATFKVDDKIKHIHFGLKNSLTYTEGADDKTRDNYLARHNNAREDWTTPLTPASLSAHILWGTSQNINKNIALFKKKFNV